MIENKKKTIMVHIKKKEKKVFEFTGTIPRLTELALILKKSDLAGFFIKGFKLMQLDRPPAKLFVFACYLSFQCFKRAVCVYYHNNLLPSEFQKL